MIPIGWFLSIHDIIIYFEFDSLTCQGVLDTTSCGNIESTNKMMGGEINTECYLKMSFNSNITDFYISIGEALYITWKKVESVMKSSLNAVLWRYGTILNWPTWFSHNIRGISCTDDLGVDTGVQTIWNHGDIGVEQ